MGLLLEKKYPGSPLLLKPLQLHTLIILITVVSASKPVAVVDYNERLEYPYQKFIKDVRQNETKIDILAYGSLMDADSAARTLSPTALSTARPAVAYGLKRLFNHDLPICAVPHWGPPSHADARAFLNVEQAPSAECVNGVVYTVGADDLQRLSVRELGYDLLPTSYYLISTNISTDKLESGVDADDDDDDRTNSGVCHVDHGGGLLTAYTFSAPLHSVPSVPSVPASLHSATVVACNYRKKKTLAPREGYYELTMRAAEKLGRTFYCLFCETTFLADGCTALCDIST